MTLVTGIKYWCCIAVKFGWLLEVEEKETLSTFGAWCWRWMRRISCTNVRQMRYSPEAEEGWCLMNCLGKGRVKVIVHTLTQEVETYGRLCTSILIIIDGCFWTWVNDSLVEKVILPRHSVAPKLCRWNIANLDGTATC